MIAFIRDGQHIKYDRNWPGNIHVYEGGSYVAMAENEGEQPTLYRSITGVPCDMVANPDLMNITNDDFVVGIMSHKEDNYLVKRIRGHAKKELIPVDDSTIVIECLSSTHGKYIRTLINRDYSNYAIITTLCERLSLDIDSFRTVSIKDYLPPQKVIKRLPVHKIKGYVKKKLKCAPDGKLL